MVTVSAWDRMYSPRKEVVSFSECHEIFSDIQSKCLHRLTELLVYIHDSKCQHIRRKQVGILDKGANQKRFLQQWLEWTLLLWILLFYFVTISINPRFLAGEDTVNLLTESQYDQYCPQFLPCIGTYDFGMPKAFSIQGVSNEVFSAMATL